MSRSDKAAAAAVLREAAMRHEPDRYLAGTLAPADAGRALIAIAAFSAELARIPMTVCEPVLGRIRLQWWRDALDEGRRGGRTGHPVAEAISEAERRHGMQAQLLAAMIDVREIDLDGGVPQDGEELDAYLEVVEGHPFRLAMRVLGAAEGEVHLLATHAALAYGIARTHGRLDHRMRWTGHESARPREVRPSSEAQQPTNRVSSALRNRARTNMASVRACWRGLPRRLRPSLLPLAMVEPYLQAQSGFEHRGDMARVLPLTRVLHIGVAHLTGRL